VQNTPLKERYIKTNQEIFDRINCSSDCFKPLD